MEDKTEMKNFLVEKKIKIVPVNRTGGMIDDPNHIGYFRYDGTKIVWVLPISRSKRTLMPILNTEEKEFFEKLLDLDLNFYKKNDNFWHKFYVEILVDDNFKKNGMILDLSDPMDNLKWRVWKTCPLVAHSWEERFDSGAYILAMVDEGYQEEQKATKAAKNLKAYKHLGKIEGSHTKLFDFLTIYALQHPKAKHPSSDSTIEALITQAEGVIVNDVSGYLDIVEDAEYETKLLIHRAIMAEAIVKKWSTKEYLTPEGKLLGNSLDDVVRNLRSAEYQEDYLKIKAVVTANKKAKE